MARQVVRLTDKQIKTAKGTGKEYTLSDGGGLQLRVRANGSKSWQLKYSRPTDKKAAKFTLGVYPNLSLANARKAVAQQKELIAQGIDPKQHKIEQTTKHKTANKNTLLAVAMEWFERKKENVTPEHAYREWRTLEKYIFPELGKLPITHISAPLTIEILRPLEKAGKLSTIKRICQSLNQVMDYATNSGMVHANPLAKIIKVFKKHKVEHMPTIRPEELETFLKELHEASSLQNKTKLLILWQLHTMTRPKEAARTQWEDIDLVEKVWTIPAGEMKRRQQHRVPLTPQAIEILEAMRPISGDCRFVFSGERDQNSHLSTYTSNAAIKRTLGYQGKLVAHGLRAIASTALHEKGLDSLLIESCLAHSDENETRASYNRSDYLEQRRPIMNWWSQHIEGEYPTQTKPDILTSRRI